jgi:hypothetical protein
MGVVPRLTWLRVLYANVIGGGLLVILFRIGFGPSDLMLFVTGHIGRDTKNKMVILITSAFYWFTASTTLFFVFHFRF